MPRIRLILEDDNGRPLVENAEQIHALELKIAELNGQWKRLWQQPACPA